MQNASTCGAEGEALTAPEVRQFPFSGNAELVAHSDWPDLNVLAAWQIDADHVDHHVSQIWMKVTCGGTKETL